MPGGLNYCSTCTTLPLSVHPLSMLILWVSPLCWQGAHCAGPIPAPMSPALLAHGGVCHALEKPFKHLVKFVPMNRRPAVTAALRASTTDTAQCPG